MSDPQSMLPEEAWNLIFNCVDNSMDILSCSQVCTLFKNSLASTRTTWAFPLVFPSLLKYLPKTDVFQCRLVSKSWLKVIDNFMQSDQFAPTLVQHLRHYDDPSSTNFLTRIPKHQTRPVENRNLERNVQNWHIGQNDALIGGYLDGFLVDEPEVLDLHQPHHLLIVNLPHARQIRPLHVNENGDWMLGNLDPFPIDEFERFDRGNLNFHARQVEDLHPEPEVPDNHQSQLVEFISVFGDNHKSNPFPSRAVVLIITDTDIKHALQFLDFFGVHIWSLGLVVKLTSLGMYQVLQFIWKILDRVPNLKHLCFGESAGHVHSYRGINLNAFLTNCTTPALKQLKWIELKISNLNMHDIIVEAFGSRSVTIFGFPRGIRPHHISANGWKHLNLELHAAASTWEWDMHMTSLKHLHLPLESIELRYPKCENLQSIFDNLIKYKSTLRQLTLTFTNLRKQEFDEMRQQANAIFTSFLSQMKCLDSFKLVENRENSTT